MPKTSLILVFSLLICINLSYSQVIDPDIPMTTPAGKGPGFVRELKPKVENPYSRNYYLRNRWQTGSIQFENGDEISNVPLKYDLVKNLIEVKYGEEVYYVSSYNVKSFEWFDFVKYRESEFLRCRDFEVTDDDDRPIGFFENIYDGKMSVYTYYTVNVFQGNSSVSLSGSHRENDIIWNEEYFVNYGDESHLVKLHPKRKPNLYLFAGHEQEVLRFMRNNGYWFKNESHIIKTIDYYNSLQ